MINFPTANNLLPFSLPAEEEAGINVLPIDIMVEIFAFLGTQDIQSTSQVSRGWRNITIILKRREFSTIKKSLEFLHENTINETSLNKKLELLHSRFIADESLLDSAGLKDLTDAIHRWEEKIFNIFEALEDESCGNLEKVLQNQKVSQTAKEIFSSAMNSRIEKLIKEVNPEDGWARDDALRTLSKASATKDQFYSAVKIAEKINTVYQIKDDALGYAAERLIKMFHIDQAIEIAELMSKTMKEYTLRNIVWKLIEMGQIDAARTIADRIKNTYYGDQCFNPIS